MNQQGTLEACLKAFRGTNKSNDRLIADFCHVSSDTVRKWNASRLPKGEPLNRLWYLLEHFGYTVDELNRLHPVVRYLGRLIAFDVVTKKEALALLKLKNEQQLWAALQGRLTPMRVKSQEVTLEQLQAEHAELLLYATGDLAGTRPDRLPPELQEKTLCEIPPLNSTEPRAEEQPKALDRHGVDDVVVMMAASSLRALKPLLEHIGAAGPEKIDRLRAAVGSDDDFHDLLDLLKSFSSRKAREFYRGK